MTAPEDEHEPVGPPNVPLVLRTPDDRFEGLEGFDHRPRYVTVDDRRLGPLRLHHVEAGPAGGDPVVLLHGQPTWSYLWRTVIDRLAALGHRVLAPDLVGFGRSDKPARRTDHTVAGHVAWTGAWLEALNLRHVTLVAQDWGGPIGLGALAAAPGRFDRVVAANTILHACDPAMDADVSWANHADGHGHVVLQQELVDYVLLSQRLATLQPSLFVRFATAEPPPEAVLAAYDAPFPDERYLAGPRQFPVLIPLTPSDPGTAVTRAAWEVLRRWEKPFLTVYSDGDPASRGWDRVFHRLVPGAAGRPPVTLAGAGHFLQEDRGEALADAVDAFVQATPAG